MLLGAYQFEEVANPQLDAPLRYPTDPRRPQPHLPRERLILWREAAVAFSNRLQRCRFQCSSMVAPKPETVVEKQRAICDAL